MANTQYGSVTFYFALAKVLASLIDQSRTADLADSVIEDHLACFNSLRFLV